MIALWGIPDADRLSSRCKKCQRRQIINAVAIILGTLLADRGLPLLLAVFN